MRRASLWCRCAPHSLHIDDDAALTAALARRFVTMLQAVLARKSRAVITTSAGRTLRPTYQRLRECYADALDWQRVVCIQMDEYEGLGSADERSLAAQLRHDLIEPLGIGRFLQFYDRAGQPACPLHEYERQLTALGGLDCAFHGVGRNAHVGFNEPGASPASVTRSVCLTDSTRMANGVAFARGVTLGLAALRTARSSMIVLRGAAKRSAAAALLHGPLTREQPVTLLRAGCVSVFLDYEAAGTAYPRRGPSHDTAVGPEAEHELEVRAAPRRSATMAAGGH